MLRMRAAERAVWSQPCSNVGVRHAIHVCASNLQISDMQQNQRPRLLVVDDDRAILTLIGTIALAEGFDVATTVNGEDAMKQLRHRPAELVLLDLRMPGDHRTRCAAIDSRHQPQVQGGADDRLRHDRQRR